MFSFGILQYCCASSVLLRACCTRKAATPALAPALQPNPGPRASQGWFRSAKATATARTAQALGIVRRDANRTMHWPIILAAGAPMNDLRKISTYRYLQYMSMYSTVVNRICPARDPEMFGAARGPGGQLEQVPRRSAPLRLLLQQLRSAPFERMRRHTWLAAILGMLLSARAPAGLSMASTARPTAELCQAMANFTVHDGPKRLWARGSSNDVLTWYSSSAMPQLGAVEVARVYPSTAAPTLRWATALLDEWLRPGQPAAEGIIAGTPWNHWCDQNGVPPTVFVAVGRGTKSDRAAILAFANQTRTYPALGKVAGAAQLPDGAVARSTSGGWRVALPRGNKTVITWPDDCFMCTAMLSHAAPVVGPVLGPQLLEEAARRLLAVIESGQRDHSDGLLWHGFDAASGAHSCCKWGDGNGWMVMAMADALKGFQLSNHTASHSYTRLLEAFREFSAAWLRVQRPSGMWTVLLDEPDTFECSSATGFVLYSLATGVQIGALGGDEIKSAISRGWQALASSFVQPDGSVAVRNAFLVPILYKIGSFYQDRLGTNI